MDRWMDRYAYMERRLGLRVNPGYIKARTCPADEVLGVGDDGIDRVALSLSLSIYIYIYINTPKKNITIYATIRKTIVRLGHLLEQVVELIL